MDDIKARFIEEANDLIADLEKALLVLEANPDKKDQIEQVFRVMHTLKGTSSMFGFDLVGDLTHDLETIYDHIRSGKAKLTEDILTTTLESIDHIKELLKNDQRLGVQSNEKHKSLTRKILEIVESIEGKDGEKESDAAQVMDVADEQVKTYYILFRPKDNILVNGSNPIYLIEDLCALGECRVTAHCNNIPDFDALDPRLCYVYWDIYLASKETAETIKEVFMFVEGNATIEVHKVSDINILTNENFIKKVEEVEGDISAGDLKEFVNNLLQIIKGKTPAEEKVIQSSKENVAGSIRVATEKLDNLMNLVSELVTVQARLSLFAEQNFLPELVAITENVEKITRQLRDNAFSIVLVPFENTLIRFQRLVRDLSLELNKDIIFLTEGGETELDKTIIENLIDPLMHLLRNSLDHGIESKEERIKAGKAEKAKILIRAFYSGNEVHIQIKDDGRGIDPEKIKKKALEKGLINDESMLSDREALDLIFLPGFSTAEKVTGVSGRGVGMDVVKRKIAELRGEIQIESLVGIGTTITIKLPLTLSIIDGLLVKVDHTFFVIPLLSVDKCYEKAHKDIATAFNNTTVVDGEQIPFLFLRNEFNIHNNCPDLHQMVSVKYENNRVGLVVDSIIGEYQAVLKPLGKLYNDVEIISGGTILGDGTVALILDSHKIIKEFSNRILI